MLKKIRNYIIVIALMFIYLWSQNTIIEVEKIEIDEELITEEIVIAHVSDLHIERNGPDINTILNKLRDIKPDIIITTGDIVDGSCHIEDSQLEEFAKGRSTIAPTYGVSGNHDRWNKDRDLWYQIMEENQNIILENDTKLINIKGQDISLIGVKDGYAFNSDIVPEDIKNSPMPKILMIHRPNKYKNDGMKISIIMS